MGGYGSGRGGGRPTYEGCGALALQVGTFSRAGLRFGVRGTVRLTFTCDGEAFPVAVIIDTTDRYWPFMELTHARRCDLPGDLTYRVPLQTTVQRFGGVRWWFQCPATGARAVKLFLPRGGHRFLSRCAYRLGYASQRESAMDRAWRRGSKLHRSMGGGDADWRDGPPPKPKWMRWRTYERKSAELDAQYARYDGAWLAGASRLLARSPTRLR